MKKGKQKVGKGFKNASFWAINLFVGKKLNLKRRGGGRKNDQNAQYISLLYRPGDGWGVRTSGDPEAVRLHDEGAHLLRV